MLLNKTISFIKVKDISNEQYKYNLKVFQLNEKFKSFYILTLALDLSSYILCCLNAML